MNNELKEEDCNVVLESCSSGSFMFHGIPGQGWKLLATWTTNNQVFMEYEADDETRVVFSVEPGQGRFWLDGESVAYPIRNEADAHSYCPSSHVELVAEKPGSCERLIHRCVVLGFQGSWAWEKLGAGYRVWARVGRASVCAAGRLQGRAVEVGTEDLHETIGGPR